MKLTKLLSLLLVVNPVVLLAQSDSALDQSARNSLRAVSSAIVALASDDAISAGIYKFKNDSSTDTDLSLFKWVGELPLADQKEQFIPLIEISPAYLELDQDFQDRTGEINVDAWSIGLGVGVKAKIYGDRFSITPRFKVEYGEVNYDISVDGTDDSIVNQLIPDIDSWSYIPSLEGEYKEFLTTDGSAILIKSMISLIATEASTSNSNLTNFSDQSWLWRNRLSYDHLLSAAEQNNKYWIRPSLARIDIHGAARNGFEFNNFYEMGIELVAQGIEPELFSEISFGATYVYEDEIQGWRIGLLASLA